MIKHNLVKKCLKKGIRIFITGGYGFIGSHLVRRCVQENACVGVLAPFSSKPWRILDVVDKIEIFEGSVTDQKKVRDAINQFKPEIVFHLAAILDRDRSFALFDKLFDVHVRGTGCLLSILSERSDLKRFIHLGTIEEYGSGHAPFREDQNELPVSPYSLTKVMATKMVEYMANEGEVPIVVIRPPIVYGPGQDFEMLIPSTIQACIEGREFLMTSGEQTRDFLFVDDLIEGLLKAGQASEIDGEIINLGSGRETQLKEVVAMIYKIVGNSVKIKRGAIPYRHGENMHFWLDSEKANKMLGWSPKVSLQEGLERTVRWYKDNWEEISKS